MEFMQTEVKLMEYKFTDGTNENFVQLCEELDMSIDKLVGNKFDRKPYIQYNQRDDIRDVIIAYNQSELVGCASYKKYEHKVAELKRVFVKTTYRGKGIARKMLDELENRARKQGYRTMILETGEVLAASMKLYKAAGYEIIENYGQYAEMSDSICMKKSL